MNKESIKIDLDYVDAKIDEVGRPVVRFCYIVEHIWVTVIYTKEYEEPLPHKKNDLLLEWCFEVSMTADGHAGERSLLVAYMNAAVGMHVALFDDNKLRSILPIYEAQAKAQQAA